MKHAIKHFKAGLLYVDKGFIVCNKPPGLVCQAGHRVYDLGNFFPELRQRLNLRADHPFYPAHRLDKGTSGCYILARTLHMAREIIRQFESRQVTKEYFALLAGKVEGEGKIDVGLVVLPNGRVTMGGGAHGPGKPAVSHWKVVSNSDNISLVKFSIETGLKHQIRLHAASVLNAGVVGDHLYTNASDRTHRFSASQRLYLHASRFSFYRYFNNVNGRRHTITVVAPLPDAFRSLCLSSGMSLSNMEGLDLQGGLLLDGKAIPNGRIDEVGGVWLGEGIDVGVDPDTRIRKL